MRWGRMGALKLAYRDGTQVKLQQNTRLRVTLGEGENKDAKRLALDGRETGLLGGAPEEGV